ncbi:hypothetical protein N7468_005393 [Penicillium chermesinum]|uniref:Uncharacterized protein n=1 Tax=Penicillium chermesinum TaxID=63820 RepID=A0A9W9P1K4_9EURO|nr:uncharacterized protein N7468_005393 [Penicillium chermesinum]KAJ5232437.1 hypothetical protein N7468_005393 [Penicillium chermesinum]KAJ6172096.1 hypothetical protein N7470_001163 [Penicillium chermesinum]
MSHQSRTRTPDQSRKKQGEVRIVCSMPSSSPVPPGLSSGSSSPSTDSVNTESIAADYGPPYSPEVIDDGSIMAPVITTIAGPPSASADRHSAVTGERTSSSSSRWEATAAQPATETIDIQSLTLSSQERAYACLFYMLDCHDSFDEVAEWKIHVLSHFRTHPPPRTARCPICPNTKFTDGMDDETDSRDNESSAPSTPLSDRDASDPSHRRRSSTLQASSQEPGQSSAWDRLLEHVASAHYQHGHTLAGSRPDFELMRYLYGRRIISDAQFKATQLAPAPSSPAYHRSQDGVRANIGSSDEPYCAPYSRRREERARGQQRGVSVV